ncbi:MAG: TolC family protein [Gemmataceae bacterium]|nr:TolC family protein [Gemmataceae bacterium]
MSIWVRTLAVSLALAGGCTHLPGADPACRDASNPPAHAPAAACPQVTARAPVEPELEGAHAVEFYVQLALQRNPEVQARERRAAALAQTVPQVAALPDPMLSDTFWPIPARSPQTASGRMTNSLMVSQQFPWFGKLRLRGEVANLDTKIALTELAETQLKVVEQVKQTYYDLYYSQRAAQILQENERLLAKYYTSVAEILYATGKGKVSQQDVLRAQVELSRIRTELIEVEQQRKMSQADLARLLSTAPEADLRAEGLSLPPLPEQTERLYQAAVASRPELQGKLHAILREQKNAELARLQFFPDVTAGVSWDAMTRSGAIAPTADGLDNLGFQVSVNLPVRLEKYRAGVREAQDRAAESARLYQASRDDTFRLIRRLTVQFRALEEQITLYSKELIPRTDQALRVASAGYRAGQVNALQVLDNWRDLLRFQLQRARLETALGQALASLERVVGLQLATLATVRGEGQ